MQVKEMLEIMALLSVGADTLTPKAEAVFLRYLNVANINIFNKTASINPDLITTAELFTEVGSNMVFLDQKPFIIASVFLDEEPNPLTLIPFIDLILMRRKFREKTKPRFFTFTKKEIYLYPVEENQTYRVIPLYVPQPQPLEIDTDEADIPLPVSFHNLLVDEALYYLFLDEEGFKSPQRALEAKARAMELRSDLISYLYGNTNQTISTFSNI